MSYLSMIHQTGSVRASDSNCRGDVEQVELTQHVIVFWNEHCVWGRGFASGDYGDAHTDEVKGCALRPETRSFDYGLGDRLLLLAPELR